MKVYTATEIAEILEQNITVIRRKLQYGIIKGGKQKGEWLVSEENFMKYTHGLRQPVEATKFAKMVKKHPQTIKNKLVTGELKGAKLGKWYIEYDEINKFIGE
jgi:hypothetical protein